MLSNTHVHVDGLLFTARESELQIQGAASSAAQSESQSGTVDLGGGPGVGLKLAVNQWPLGQGGRSAGSGTC